MINVTIYNEYIHELQNEKVGEIYPDGIHGAIKNLLSEDKNLNIRTATLKDINESLSDEVLAGTDVLFWWGHVAHDKVPEDRVEAVYQRVLAGMGLVVLHSGHYSLPFRRLMATCCRSKWREDGDRERIWVVEHSHPIANGIPEYFDIPHEETYGERFDIPKPDDVVFISNFSGGEVFRSGCTFTRGMGKIFYFRPGHEEFPVYHMEVIGKILRNAASWCYTENKVAPTFGHYPKIEG